MNETAPQVTQAKEKTEAEIANQINRVTEKLGDRALRLEGYRPPSHLVDVGESTTATVVPLRQGESEEDDGVTGAVLGKMTMEQGSNALKVESVAITTDGDKASGQYRNETFNGSKAISSKKELTNDQIISGAANILSSARNDLAREENQKVEGFLKK